MKAPTQGCRVDFFTWTLSERDSQSGNQDLECTSNYKDLIRRPEQETSRSPIRFSIDLALASALSPAYSAPNGPYFPARSH